MESGRNRNRLLYVSILAATAIGGLSVGAFISPTEQPTLWPAETFTFPDGTKCVDGVYESAQGALLGGGCAENTNEVNSDVTVSNGDEGKASNTNQIPTGVTLNNGPTITVHTIPR